MNNQHNLDAVFSPSYLNKGIPVSIIATLQLFLGSFVLHSCLNEKDILGLLSGVLLIALGVGLFYFTRPLAAEKRVLSSLQIREDRLVFDDRIDGIHTIYWDSVVTVQLVETDKNYLRKIIVKYQDLISGGNASDTESLEIPLIVFNEADQIISCILLIAEEQGIPFEKVLL